MSKVWEAANEVDALKGSASSVGARPGYLLFLLMSGYILSFFDRQILVMLIGPVSRDLGLSDTQFGLLYGFAFALFYTVVGLVFGRLVDAVNRPKILAAAIVLWSLATAACGLANDFGSLFFARMLVGVGEGALAPVAYSLIADLVEPRKRARAFSIYAMGIYLGSGIAFILGGRLIHMLDGLPPLDVPLVGPLHGWQLGFLIAGAPGIILAAALAVVKEPPRGRYDAGPVIKGSMRAFGAHTASRWRALLCHHLGFAMHTGFGYAIASWSVAYYTRVRGLSVAETGLILGLLLLVAGPIGALAGGSLADRLLRRGVADAYLRLGAIVCLVQALCVVLMVVAPTTPLALVATAGAIVTMGMTAGPAGAALQSITPAHFRGQAGAFYTFVANLIGLSLVPLLVALMTDHVFHDPKMVGVSLVAVGVGTLSFGAVLLWLGKGRFAITAQV